MTTARDLINDAAAKIGEYAADSPMSDTSAQICLRDLNRMLDMWSNERLMLFVQANETFPTVASTASYASSVITTRPVKITSCTVTLSGTTLPVELIDNVAYNEISYKAATGIPRYCYPSMAHPTATFYFYPTPDDVYTVTLSTMRVLAAALALTDSVSFPPGYEEAIVSNLAVRIAPSFGASVPPEVVEIARASKAMLKRINATPVPMLLQPLSSSRSNIYAG